MYMYIHVHDVMYLYVHSINMYVPCSDTYVPICPILSRWVGFQMLVQHGISQYDNSTVVTVRHGTCTMMYPGPGRYIPVRNPFQKPIENYSLSAK